MAADSFIPYYNFPLHTLSPEIINKVKEARKGQKSFLVVDDDFDAEAFYALNLIILEDIRSLKLLKYFEKDLLESLLFSNSEEECEGGEIRRWLREKDYVSLDEKVNLTLFLRQLYHLYLSEQDCYELPEKLVGLFDQQVERELEKTLNYYNYCIAEHPLTKDVYYRSVINQLSFLFETTNPIGSESILFSFDIVDFTSDDILLKIRKQFINDFGGSGKRRYSYSPFAPTIEVITEVFLRFYFYLQTNNKEESLKLESVPLPELNKRTDNFIKNLAKQLEKAGYISDADAFIYLFDNKYVKLNALTWKGNYSSFVFLFSYVYNNLFYSKADYSIKIKSCFYNDLLSSSNEIASNTRIDNIMQLAGLLTKTVYFTGSKGAVNFKQIAKYFYTCNKFFKTKGNWNIKLGPKKISQIEKIALIAVSDTNESFFKSKRSKS